MNNNLKLHNNNELLLQHALSGSAKILPFDPKVTCCQECLITTFQEVYFMSESFEEAKVRMRYFHDSFLSLKFLDVKT